MLRKRKNKRYNEETNDEDGDRSRHYDIRDKIRSERFERLRDLVELAGDQVTLKLIQRNGFDKPILVISPAGLDLSVPSKSFVVRDVGKLVGYDRMIDVMDVRTQKNIEMSMRDWCKYYESRNKDRLLNVISLEFSHTELANRVESPGIVKLLDWVDQVWPKFLKESQIESTNTIDKMKYPKVQKYCLMSVKGSYTDFHIDFGGTSVWYHILKGKKIFWMAPPTELNLQAFEEWTLSGMQQDVFFGDTVEECFRVELTAGNTFFIPSGWIHAVYTLEDSLVFGGNFLHSFGIENQLKVSRIEDATKVPVKFRYPFYTEILWYVVQHYVYCLTGKSHLQNSAKNSATTTPEKNSKPAVETKEVTKSNQKIVDDDDSATESEYDQSDIGKRKKTSVKQQDTKKKRGRPAKNKPPTDDESTEIDSDYEDTKPTKSSNTCRMTKNSLIRLQYELDEPQPLNDRHQHSPNKQGTNKQAKLPRDGAESNAGIKSPTKTPKSTEVTAKKISPIGKSDSIKSSTEQKSLDTVKAEPMPSLVNSIEASRLNGCSGGPNKSIWSNSDSEPQGPLKIHITKTELNGLKLLVKHLSKLSGAKKNMPNLIRNSRALLDDCKKMIAEHENDDSELAVTGTPITPDLLNPNKSDINQLIEQFFKPSELPSSDGAPRDSHSTPTKFKTDSSTLTMQHRLKYNQVNCTTKVDDRRISSPTNASVSQQKTPDSKEAKTSNSAKKMSSAASPLLSPASNPLATSSAGSASASSVDQPRPKSPPTRPLSNKQYSSRTKNDKSDSSLVLPGSFADLIAATSSAKEVFDVSSADVTSSLFGLKSPSKNQLSTKDKQTNSLNISKTQQGSPFNIDSILPTTAQANPKTQTESRKDDSPVSGSPEPSKAAAAVLPKRFITPAQNRLQVKEKLIYASAPYHSPVNSSDHSRNFPYMWTPNSQTSHQNHHSNHPTYPTQQQPRQSNQYQTSQVNPTPPQPAELRKQVPPHTTESATTIMKPSSDQVKLVTEFSQQPRKLEPSSSNPVLKTPEQPVNVSNSNHPRSNDDRAGQSSVVNGLDGVSGKVATIQHGSNDKVSVNQTQGDPHNSSNLSHPTSNESITTVKITATDEQKIKKPRGPPKKSKEARQVAELDLSEPAPQATPISVIRSNSNNAPQVTPQVGDPGALSTPSGKPSAQQESNGLDLKEKPKSKPKRAKKQKDEPPIPAKGIETSTNLPQPVQTRPPVICGLVRTPTTIVAAPNSTSSAQAPKAGQQYFISRPMLFNSMSAFSPAHLPPAPASSMPLFTAPIHTSMGLHNMQPGARIFLATRPQVPTSAASNSTATRPAVAPQPQQAPPKKKAQKAPVTTSTDLKARQPDRSNALLTLATTAESTAPLPTTPTLSNISSRLPNPAHTFMVNPLPAHQYCSPYPYMQTLVPFDSSLQQNPASLNLARTPFRPAAPRPATARYLFAPIVNQTAGQQPRYLITQPGFMPGPQAAPLYANYPNLPNLSFPAFQPQVGPSPPKDAAKVKKVKTR